jgi:sec-independent protein translocase protein TatA
LERNPEQCYNAGNHQCERIASDLEAWVMLQQIGPFELIIVLVIVLLLFGVGRVGKVGKELGSAISEFRKGLNEGKEDENKEDKTDDSAS